MFEESQEREERAIRIDTVDGPIEGCLHVSPKLRTLDDLNLVATRFVTVYSHSSPSNEWNFGSGPLAINRSSVLFVRELAPPPPRPNNRFCNFTRSPVRIRVKSYEIEGFCHVPPGGAPMKRLEHGEHPFISLTTVLVTGPDGQSTAPFVAVNREHISAVQEVDLDEGEAPDAVRSGVTSEA